MSDAKERLERTEVVISRALRIGVTASLGVILAGVIWLFIDDARVRSSSSLEKRLLTTGAHYPHHPDTIYHALHAGRPVALILVGLVLLVLTPFMRVIVSIAIFVVQRDRHFVIITTFVLAVLVASLFLGVATQ